MFSINYNLFYRRIQHDVCEKSTVHKLEKNAKTPCLRDKSETRRKVVIVKGTLIQNFMIKIIVHKF